MAGTLIVSNLTTDTDNTFIVRSNTGTTLFSANTTGIDVANSIGATAITSDKILSVANTKISGNIVSSQITSVANTQISGNIISSQIAPSVTLTTPLISGNLNFDANGTSGIRLTSANTLTLHTTGTEDMRIDSVGNVMIGTTTSQTGAKLSVTGGIQGIITSGTAVASTSGTSIDFTGIPSWVKKVTVILSGTGTSSSSHKLIQLGTSGGIVTSGYTSTSTLIYGNNNCVNESFSTSFGIRSDTAADALNGTYVFVLFGSNTWVGTSLVNNHSNARVWHGAGQVSLGGTLDRVRITTAGGDTFVRGSINILYEG